MLKKLYKYIALFFPLLTGYYVSGKEVVSHFKASSISKSRPSTILSSLRPNRNSHVNIISNFIPVQLVNFQQHKTVHSVQGVPNRFNSSFIYLKYLNFICGYGTSELSRYRKLILFPFHAFW